MVREALAALGFDEPVSASSLTGGCIHDVRLVALKSGDRVVCKVAAGGVGRRMLRCEARGLAAIAAAESLRTPSLRGLVEREEGAVLVMEHLPKGSTGDWASAGRALASMHSMEGTDRYGSDEEVWLGGTCLAGGWDRDWCEHLAERRLRPLLRDVVDSRTLDKGQASRIESVINTLSARIPTRPKSALLHGDLWAGNLHVMLDGTVAVLDPAATHGDPYADIAMSMLFGGIPRAFFGAWREAMGPADGAHERIAVGQMFHLLNHTKLFGVGYVPRLLQVVSELE